MSVDPREPSTTLSEKDAAPITKFVDAAPNSTYKLEEKGDITELCRGEGPSRTCVEIKEDVTKIFALFQKKGFFCALPFDPTHTEIECTKIEKLAARA